MDRPTKQVSYVISSKPKQKIGKLISLVDAFLFVSFFHLYLQTFLVACEAWFTHSFSQNTNSSYRRIQITQWTSIRTPTSADGEHKQNAFSEYYYSVVWVELIHQYIILCVIEYQHFFSGFALTQNRTVLHEISIQQAIESRLDWI